MVDQVQITGGQFQNPYKQFTYTLSPRERLPVYYAFDFVRILDIVGTASNLQMRFGDTGDTTNVIGAGIGFKLPVAVQRLDIINTSSVDNITVTIAMCIGYISDDRLNVSGTVTTVVTSASTISDIADVSVNAGATTLVKAAGTRKTLLLSNLQANATLIRIGTSSAGAARGVEVPIGQTASLDSQAAWYVYNPSASTINIGIVELIQ